MGVSKRKRPGNKNQKPKQQPSNKPDPNINRKRKRAFQRDEDTEYFKEHGEYIEYIDGSDGIKIKQGTKTRKVHHDDIDSDDDHSFLPSHYDKTELKILVNRQNEVSKLKDEIALLSTGILEDPEKKISKLKDLLELCHHSDLTIQKLSIVSLLKVFKDIIPEYRIATGIKDEGVQLSKAVKQLRKYEFTLLSNYQKYIQLLDSFIRKAFNALKRMNDDDDNNNDDDDDDDDSSDIDDDDDEPKDYFQSKMHKQSLINIGKVSLISLGELLISKDHFNFTSIIIQTFIRLLSMRKNHIFTDIASSYIIKLFNDQSKMDASLECVKLISNVFKKKKGNLDQMNPVLLKILVHLQLDVKMDEDDDIFNPVSKKKKKKKDEYKSKKERKKEKIEKKIEEDLRKASLEDDKEHKNQVQTDILKRIFIIYFKVLKKSDSPRLLPYVIEGVSLFSNLINVDLLLNIIDLMKNLLKSNQLSLSSAMHCLLTGLRTLDFKEDVLNVDLKDFYTYIYNLLIDISLKYDSYDENIPLLLKSLDLLLLKKKSILGIERVGSFIKRLASMALNLRTNGSISILTLIIQLLGRYTKTQQLLDMEYCGSGVYRPDIDDPEYSNVFSTSLFEVFLLKDHISESVRKISSLLMNFTPVNSIKGPESLYNDFKFNYNVFMKSLKQPKEHEIEKKKKKKNKKGLEFFFIKKNHINDDGIERKSSFIQRIESKRKDINLIDKNTLFQRYFEEKMVEK